LLRRTLPRDRRTIPKAPGQNKGVLASRAGVDVAGVGWLSYGSGSQTRFPGFAGSKSRVSFHDPAYSTAPARR
jgi:hypothetical protein